MTYPFPGSKTAGGTVPDTLMTRSRHELLSNSQDGVHCYGWKRPGLTAFQVSSQSGARESALLEAGLTLQSHGAAIIGEYEFGREEPAPGDSIDAFKNAAAGGNPPATWLWHHTSPPGLFTGSQFLAVTGDDCAPIVVDGRIAGFSFSDDYARYAYLSGLLPSDTRSSRGDQTMQAFQGVEEALAQVGMNFSHVARTWLYIDHILDWYDELNEVRSAFFDNRGTFNRLVPASTGIGVCNQAGAAIVMGALAVDPLGDEVSITSLPSPLQCPALDYKSAFSRAVEIALPQSRMVMVSGTASIEPGGATVYVGDPARQIDLTMRVVEAILASREMGWGDVTRGIAYFTDMAYVGIFQEYLTRAGIPDLPYVVSHSDICRDDLLFELEVDAIQVSGD